MIHNFKKLNKDEEELSFNIKMSNDYLNKMLENLEEIK